MEKMKLPKGLQQITESHSDKYCDKHPFRRGSEIIPNPVKFVEFKGKAFCPRCEKEKRDRKLEQEIQSWHKVELENRAYNTLADRSIIEDQTLIDARLGNYDVSEPEETENKRIAEECLKRFSEGEVFNLILQGNQGAGKSHLAYAVLHELNEQRKGSCLFISINAMMRKIKDSFNNKESKFTEDYFIDLISKVDFLALDDLGAETGAIDSERRATDFTQRVLYAATSARQSKVTILTTNLASKTLYTMYDKKLISRLLKRPKYVIFKETSDKRTSEIPF